MGKISVINDKSIALMQKDISYIQRDVESIKDVLKEGYATKESLADVARETERRLLALENSSNVWKWISPTLAAVLGSVLTFLLVQYLMGVR